MAELSVRVTESGIDATDRKLKKIGKTGDGVEKSFRGSSKSVKDFGKNAAAAIASVDGPLGGISSRVSSVTTLLTSGTAAVTVAAAGFAGFAAAVYQGVDALDQYEVDLIRVDSILKATGGAAGFTAEQLREQADALALATLTSTNEVQKAQAQLLTFNRVSGDVFTNAIELSQDLAESGFGSITGNAVQLGKALQDPIQGISALTRVGVSFNDSQKETIRLAQESGDIFAAQAVVIQALKEQVGGAGAAVAENSLAGKFDTAGQRWDEFTRALAERTGALDLTKEGVDLVTAAIENLTRSLTGGTIEDRIRVANAEYDNQLKIVNSLRQSKEKLDEIDLKSLGSSEALASVQGRINKNQQELITAETLLNEKTAERNALLLEQQGIIDANNSASIIASQKQAELDKQAASDRKASADKLAQEQAEKDAQRLADQEARQQESIDRQVESIRVGLLTEDQLRLENALNQAELISQSTLAQEEQAALLTGVWGAYYDDIALKAMESAQKRADEEEKLRRDNERIERRQRKDRISALDQSTADLENALGEQSGIFKAVATTNAIVKTYEAANSSYAALASIPIVGPALGAAAAGAAIASGLANVAAINSARAQGGQVNRGDNVLVGERSPEVFVPNTSGRILTPQQLSNQMGGNGGVMINIYNQAGVNVNATENANGGADIYITREEFNDGLAAAAGDPNSDFGQRLQGTYRLERP